MEGLYYIPPGPDVRQLGPHEKPSLGMVAPYAQTRVRTFETQYTFQSRARSTSSSTSSGAARRGRKAQAKRVRKGGRRSSCDSSCNRSRSIDSMGSDASLDSRCFSTGSYYSEYLRDRHHLRTYIGSGEADAESLRKAFDDYWRKYGARGCVDRRLPHSRKCKHYHGDGGCGCSSKHCKVCGRSWETETRNAGKRGRHGDARRADSHEGRYHDDDSYDGRHGADRHRRDSREGHRATYRRDDDRRADRRRAADDRRRGDTSRRHGADSRKHYEDKHYDDSRDDRRHRRDNGDRFDRYDSPSRNRGGHRGDESDRRTDDSAAYERRPARKALKRMPKQAYKGGATGSNSYDSMDDDSRRGRYYERSYDEHYRSDVDRYAVSRREGGDDDYVVVIGKDITHMFGRRERERMAKDSGLIRGGSPKSPSRRD